eukprot:1160339-Pelagomonas_calceolata.AAC.1
MWRDCGDVAAARDLFEGGVRANPGDLYVWQAWGYMEGFVVVSGCRDEARKEWNLGKGMERRTLWGPEHCWDAARCVQGSVERAATKFDSVFIVSPLFKVLGCGPMRAGKRGQSTPAVPGGGVGRPTQPVHRRGFAGALFVFVCVSCLGHMLC